MLLTFPTWKHNNTMEPMLLSAGFTDASDTGQCAVGISIKLLNASFDSWPISLDARKRFFDDWSDLTFDVVFMTNGLFDGS